MDANTLPYRAQPKSILKTREVHGRAKDGGHVPHGTNGKWNDHTTRIAETRIDMSDDAKTVTHFDEVEMSPTPGRNKPTTKATEFERKHTREQWKQESSQRQSEISRSHETPEMRAQRKKNFDPDASWTVGHVTEEDISEEEQAIRDRFAEAKANARANALGVKPTSQERDGAKALHVPSPSEIQENRAALEKERKEQKEKSAQRIEKRRLAASKAEDKDLFTATLKRMAEKDSNGSTSTARSAEVLELIALEKRAHKERKKAEKASENPRAGQAVENAGMSIENDIDNDPSAQALERIPQRVPKAPKQAPRAAAMQRQIDPIQEANNLFKTKRYLAIGLVLVPAGIGIVLVAHFDFTGNAALAVGLFGGVVAASGALALGAPAYKALKQHCYPSEVAHGT